MTARLAAVCLGLSGCGYDIEPCPVWHVPPGTYTMADQLGDMQGTMTVTETGMVLDYTTADGKQWRATYVRGEIDYFAHDTD